MSEVDGAMRPSRKLLVLDLDETLVHASERPLDRPADFRIHHYHVHERPHMAAFIAWALDRFHVGVWTSSGRLYAEPLVARIFPPDRVRFLWCGDRCTLARDWDTGEYRGLKCLKKLRRNGWLLESILVVDDSPWKHVRNYGNLVAVSEFLGDPADDELPRLAAYLDTLREVPNIRTIEKRRWRERTIVDGDLLSAYRAPAAAPCGS